MKISDYIEYSDEVLTALKNNKPVVAIETGGTFEGIPYPENVKTAERVMDAQKNMIIDNASLAAKLSAVM